MRAGEKKEQERYRKFLDNADAKTKLSLRGTKVRARISRTAH